jgi:hypothetical protein
MQFYSAIQDLCFQVYGRQARQLYPWDLEDPDLSSSEKDFENGKNSSLDSFDFDSMSTANSASPSTATFSIRTMRRSKIFEEEVPIEDEYVKNVQRARYIRTWIVASAVAGGVIAVFLGVPNLPR